MCALHGGVVPCTVSAAGADLSTVTVPLGSMMCSTHTTSVSLNWEIAFIISASVELPRPSILTVSLLGNFLNVVPFMIHSMVPLSVGC